MLKFVPGSELITFVVRPREAQVTDGGRVLYRTGEGSVVKAAVSRIEPAEQLSYGQTEHPATHRLVIRGRAALEPGDVLEHGEVRYFVRHVRDAGMLGMFTVALCERRLL